MADSNDNKAGEQKGGYKDRPWIPRFWDGIVPWAWFPLLWRNRFHISPVRVPMAVLMTVLCPVNFVLWVLQMAFYGRKIARTEVKEAPIFVIGHWRSGTTLLHELLVLDSRHTYPDTFDCFAPNHFLVSGWFLRPLVGCLLPSQRPIDNMAAGWDRPQEDEFALCNMGVRSPYLTIAFPNHPPQDQEYCTLEGISPEARNHWKASVMWLLKCLTVRRNKRIILKSPPHTARVKTLLEMFPDARFIHIVRNPYVIFPSTVNLWKRLYKDQGLQVPNYKGLEDHVFQTLCRMYETFERDRGLIAENRLCEIRYEDLVADPIEQMRKTYERLELGGFDAVLPALKQYFAEKSDYKTNRYRTSPELCAEISRRWASYIARYGYADSVTAAPAAASKEPAAG